MIQRRVMRTQQEVSKVRMKALAINRGSPFLGNKLKYKSGRTYRKSSVLVFRMDESPYAEI